MNMFSRKLESAYEASGGRKIRIITHSMGGLLVKCFMSLHPDVGYLSIANSFCSCICSLIFLAKFDVLTGFQEIC